MYFCLLGVFSNILSHLLVRGKVAISSFKPKEERDLENTFFENCFALLQALAVGNTRVRVNLNNS